MAKKSEQSPQNTRLTSAWGSMATPQMGEALNSLVRETADRYRPSRSGQNLSPQQRESLTQAFHNAETGRSTASKFMSALAKALTLPGGIPCESILADMKEFDRAAEKYLTEGRNMRDLGRGRIPIHDPKQAKLFYKLMHSKKANGTIPSLSEKVAIIDGSLQNCLESPRRSGFAGFINFDLEIPLKGGKVGHFEIQIMPDSYIATDARSHKLYKMIRILDEIPKSFRTKEQQYLHDGLVIANKALFDEDAMRTGFSVLRKDPIKPLSREKAEHAYDVLDKILMETTEKYPKQPTWAKQTIEALSMAKTSVGNMLLLKQRGATVDEDRAPG